MAKTQKAKPKGRPSAFTEELAAEICERLSKTNGGLEAVCKADDMPSDRTVYRWLADPTNEDFRQAYALARERLGDTYADRTVIEAMSATDASIGRLRMDALKWAASKLAPKKYGDKLDLAVDGGITVELVNFAPHQDT